jgi:hypothetical protein
MRGFNEPGYRPRLLHVAFQHSEQFVQLASAVLGIGRTLDALVGVLVNDHLGKGLQRLARGDHLHEHLGAIAVRLDHSLNGGELPADLAQSQEEGALFLGGMLVMMGSHAAE